MNPNLNPEEFFEQYSPEGYGEDSWDDWSPLSEDRFEDLKTSLAEEGQRDPVLVDPGRGKVMHGHHRAAALRDLGQPIRTEPWSAEEARRQREQG